MTRQELNQIYHLNKELKMWQQELKRLRQKSILRSPQITGMPRGGGISNKVEDMATEQAEIEKIIEGKLKEIQMARRNTIEYIQGITDSRMRQILFYRKVSCMSWTRAGVEMGETADSLRMAYNRFMEREFPRTEKERD